MRCVKMKNEEEKDEEASGISHSVGELTPPRNEDKLRERARRTMRLACQWEESPKERAEAEHLLHFGQLIRERREEHGHTRKSLAETTDIESESLFRLEKGLLTRSEIEALFEAVAPELRCTAGELREELNNHYLSPKREPQHHE